MSIPAKMAVGMLLSGGLDSAILLGTLLGHGCRVQPLVAKSTHTPYAAIHGFAGGNRDIKLATAEKLAELFKMKLTAGKCGIPEILVRAGSGWGGIRTPGGLSPTSVFKTDAIDHSATHPKNAVSSALIDISQRLRLIGLDPGTPGCMLGCMPDKPRTARKCHDFPV